MKIWLWIPLLLLGECFAQVKDIDVEDVRRRVANGDSVAMMELSEAFEFGRGLPFDLDSAWYWQGRSANEGYAHAQYLVGVFYVSRIYTRKTFSQGVNWLNKAGKQNYSPPLLKLREIYLEPGEDEGHGTVSQRFHDSTMAHNFTVQAAESGDPVAMRWAGNDLVTGMGVKADSVKGKYWLEKAANEYTLPDAQLDLAQFLLRGKITGRPELIHALELIQRAYKNPKSTLDQRTRADILAYYTDGEIKKVHNKIMESCFLFPSTVYKYAVGE